MKKITVSTPATGTGRLNGLKDEYWGDDGLPPEWRRNSRIGRPIR